MKDLKDVVYVCATDGCGNKQTITYFPNDKILPVTCCVKCRAGFNKELQDQMAYRLGMFPMKAVAA